MTFAHPVRVYFEDTDFSGRVYHGAYVRFLERGRTEFLRAGGLDHRALAAGEPPLFFALRRMALEFRAAALIDDLLTVTAEPEGEWRATLTLRQTVRRGADLLVEARAELCLIDAAGRPRRPPATLRAALAPPAGPILAPPAGPILAPAAGQGGGAAV